VVEGHGKYQVGAWFQEAVSTSEVSNFSSTTTQQRADGATNGLRASALVDTDTQVNRVALGSLLTPARRPFTHTYCCCGKQDQNQLLNDVDFKVLYSSITEIRPNVENTSTPSPPMLLLL